MNKNRWGVDRIFRSTKRWFGSGKARYKGLVRVHTELLYRRLWRITCILPLALL
ncbi:MAG: hypothetical protein ACMUEL_04475 [Flavobacteriales bacterium Tduv]